MDIVYNSYLSLAKYFEQSDDTFLSNHFYKLCLETSVKVRGDGRRKEAEANFSMGVAYEKQGDLLFYYMKILEFPEVSWNILGFLGFFLFWEALKVYQHK